MDKPTLERDQWSVNTALEYALSQIVSMERRLDEEVELRNGHLAEIIQNNDRRYEQRFESSQRALDAALAAQKEAIASALLAADRAVTKAELASEKRFESVNEFRGTLTDQQRTFISRTEVAGMASARDQRLDALEKSLDRLQAERLGVKGGWGYAVGLVGLLMGLASLVALIVKIFTP